MAFIIGASVLELWIMMFLHGKLVLQGRFCPNGIMECQGKTSGVSRL